jgi:hypothetical protein
MAVGDIYLADQNKNCIYKVNAGGTVIAATITGIGNPYDMCTDYQGNVFALDYRASSGFVYKVDTGSIVISNTIPFGSLLLLMCSDPFDNIYIYSRGDSKIYKISAGTIIATAFITVTGVIKGMCSDSSGNIYYTVESNGTNSYIYKIAAGTNSAVIFVTIAGGNSPGAIHADPFDNIYLIYGSSGAYKIAAGSTPLIPITGLGANCLYICSDPFGNIYIANENTNSKVYKINAGTTFVVAEITTSTYISAIGSDYLGNIFVSAISSTTDYIYKINAGTTTANSLFGVSGGRISRIVLIPTPHDNQQHKPPQCMMGGM